MRDASARQKLGDAVNTKMGLRGFVWVILLNLPSVLVAR